MVGKVCVQYRRYLGFVANNNNNNNNNFLSLKYSAVVIYTVLFCEIFK
jgi:hypothetical protein